MFLRQMQGRFAEACPFAREAQTLEPVSPYVSAILGCALMLNGQNTDALAELERGLDLAHDSLHVLWISGAAYMRSGLHDESVAALEPAETTLDELHARGRTAYVSPVFKAWILGALGRIDEAFDLLEQGYQERSPLLPTLVYPPYDTMRNDARFNDLSRRMNVST